jgi:hypothetical protein
MAKQEKQVQVVARYACKRNGKLNGVVCYRVRSSNGHDDYCTTLVNGRATGCSCPARKPCYHMHQLEEREAARSQVDRSFVPPVNSSNAPEMHEKASVMGEGYQDTTTTLARAETGVSGARVSSVEVRLATLGLLRGQRSTGGKLPRAS